MRKRESQKNTFEASEFLGERYLNHMKQLDMEIEVFENMNERAKNRIVTERDLYAIRLWLRGIFSLPAKIDQDGVDLP